MNVSLLLLTYEYTDHPAVALVATSCSVVRHEIVINCTDLLLDENSFEEARNSTKCYAWEINAKNERGIKWIVCTFFFFKRDLSDYQFAYHAGERVSSGSATEILDFPVYGESYALTTVRGVPQSRLDK